MKITSISPIRIHFNLRPGVTDVTPGYGKLLASISEAHAKWTKLQTESTKLHVKKVQGYEGMYRNLDEDTRTGPKVFTMESSQDSSIEFLRAHVYSNSIGIIEISFQPPDEISNHADKLADYIVEESEKRIKPFYKDKLFPFLKKLSNKIGPKWIEPIGRYAGFQDMNRSPYGDVPVFWTARILNITDNEIDQRRQFLKEWFENTSRPQDADEIIQRQRRYAIRWLNYAYVSNSMEEDRSVHDGLLLAQYFYAAHEACDKNLHEILSNAFIDKNTRKMGSALKSIRAATELNIAGYYDIKNT